MANFDVAVNVEGCLEEKRLRVAATEVIKASTLPFVVRDLRQYVIVSFDRVLSENALITKGQPMSNPTKPKRLNIILSN
eukprot:2268417-Amphidinium_carterae.1